MTRSATPVGASVQTSVLATSRESSNVTAPGCAIVRSSRASARRVPQVRCASIARANLPRSEGDPCHPTSCTSASGTGSLMLCAPGFALGICQSAHVNRRNAASTCAGSSSSLVRTQYPNKRWSKNSPPSIVSVVDARSAVPSRRLLHELHVAKPDCCFDGGVQVHRREMVAVFNRGQRKRPCVMVISSQCAQHCVHIRAAFRQQLRGAPFQRLLFRRDFANRLLINPSDTILPSARLDDRRMVDGCMVKLS